MAEKSILWTTGALGDGTNPYTQAEAISWQFRTFGDGIHKNYLNELEPTGAAPNVQVDTGSALVSGIPYLNDAAVNVNIPTPVVDPRIDRIVLRASWAAATVRLTRIAGIEGGAAPAITQTLGVTWDVPICQASITVGAVITVTDERAWIKGHFHAAEMVGTLKRIFTTLGGTDGHRPIDPTTLVADERWHLCNGDVVNGFTTPNTANRLAMSAGGTYASGASGGTATKDLSHTHAVGTYAANNESAHTHAVGTYSANNESAHTHNAIGTLDMSNVQAGNHNHTIAMDLFNAAPAGGVGINASTDVHDHGGLTGSTNPAAHKHVMSGATAAGSAHTHVLAGASAAGSAHTHVLAGASASAGSAVQDVMNPWYAVHEFCYVGE